MSVLFFVCPTSEREVSSHIDIDPDSLPIAHSRAKLRTGLAELHSLPSAARDGRDRAPSRSSR